MPNTATQRYYYFALYLTAFVIPLKFIFASIAIVLLALTWVINFNKQRVAITFKEHKYLWLWLILFGLHALSYTYSIDKKYSLFDLQIKLSFFVLPFIIGTNFTIEKEHLEKVFASFISGLVTIAVYSLMHAIYVWRHTHSTDIFFYHNLIYGIGPNAVYYSLYTFLALSLLLLFQWHHTFLTHRWVLYVFTTLLLIFFILLSSKSLILLFALLVFPFYLKKLFKTRKTIGYLLVLLMVVTGGVIFFTSNPIQKRYQEILENTDKAAWLPEYEQGQKKQHFNNLTLRLFLWKTAYENVQENHLWWTGCGNGSVAQIQKKKISEYGTKYELLNVTPPLWSYNIHNMYMHILLMLGIPGLIVLLCLLITPFFVIWKVPDNTVFVFFNISVLIFMMQEAAFQTQAGIVFYTFFSIVIYNYAKMHQIDRIYN